MNLQQFRHKRPISTCDQWTSPEFQLELPLLES